jgi:peptidoglycan DL-endopeptidase CwlO
MFLVAGVLTAAEPQATQSPSAQQVLAGTADTAASDDAAEARILSAMRADRSQREPQAAPPVAAVAQRATPSRAAQPTRKATRKAATKPIRRTESAPVAASGNLSVVINFALAQVGKPYAYGQAGPNAYDCSGLVLASFARIGIQLPHGSGAIRGRGTYVPQNLWQPGTVLYWPGHVAIYLGGGRMVHAPHAGASVTVANVYGSPSGYRIA